MGIRKFDLRRSQMRKKENITLEEHSPLPPSCIRQVKPIAYILDERCLFQCAEDIVILISASLLIKATLLHTIS
jgi:hypothetical protein